MSLLRSLFGASKSNIRISAELVVPRGRKNAERWLPKIGYTVPNFHAPSTMGPVSLHDFAEGRWTVLFSHPCAYSPVCTTEIADFAARAPDFEKRGVALLGITQSALEDEDAWIKEIEKTFDVEVTFPLVSDPQKEISRHFGIYESSSLPGYAIRRTFIIDPALRLRMSFEYPFMVGRGIDEILRVIDALQTCDTYQVATPSDWKVGWTCLVDPFMSNTDATNAFSDRWRQIQQDLRVVDVFPLEAQPRR